MKCTIKYFFLIIIFSSSLTAQENNLKFERVLTEKGASGGTINCIIKDHLGFIWFGTNNGLIRYDGYNFKEFKHNYSDSNSISGNQIWSVMQDSYGDLWVGTSGKGLNRYIYKENRFIHYRHNPNDSSSLADDLEVTSIIEDKEGIIWIALWEGGFDKFDRHNNKFNHYKKKMNDPNSLINNSAYRLCEDSKGFLWIGTSRGLSKFDRVNNKFTSYKHSSSDHYSIAGNYINAIIEDRSGNLWIGCYGGLSRYDYENDSFINYKANSNKQRSISSNSVYSLCEDLFGNLWVGTDGGGLNYFNVKEKIFTRYLSDTENENTLSAVSIISLYMDNNSILWIGTAADGLNKVCYDKSKFGQISKNQFGHNSLNIKDVSAVYEDKNENIWIGTSGSGLNKYNIPSQQFTYYRKSNFQNSLTSDEISVIVGDNNNNLWIGTEEGLNFFEPEKNKFTRYTYIPDDTNSISSNKITSLLLDKKGKLWIGTDGGGLNFYNRAAKNFTRLTNPGQFSVFPSSHVWALFEDSKNNIWIGTWGMGAIRYDYNKDSFTEFNTKSVKKDSILLNVVISIGEDNFSNIWLGSWGNGLYKLNPDENKIEVYGSARQIPHENIFGILPDKANNLWISTSNGLSRFDPLTNIWKTFDEEDGLQSLEFKTGSYHKGRSGYFYFGGVKGLNYFLPENINDNKTIPPIVFTSFRIFEQEITPDRLGNNINLLEEIILPYNENFISIEFSALEFTSPGKNQYSYMLKGVDRDFIKSQDRRYAGYPDLKPGEYIFTVKASNNDGVWNNVGRSIKLIITPPFWLTLWAFIFYGFIFIFALYSLRRYELNKRKLKEEKRLREEREEARLREANLRAETAELKTKAVESEKEIEKQNIRYRIASDLHDEIGSNLSSITLLCSLMGRNVKPDGEITNQLSDISNAAKSSAESIRDIVWFLNPTSDILSRLLVRMKETANLLLRNINYNIETAEIDSDLRINPEIKRNVYLIFKEVLNNISKHSQAGKVKIRIVNENHNLSVTISDDGIGFNPDSVGEGNGLRNLNNRAEQIGAELKIISSPGKGTTICLRADIA